MNIVKRVKTIGISIILVLVMVLSCMVSGCGQQNLVYKLTVSGQITAPGTLGFLDYDINVYKDQASNPCGDCEKQPVHLYVGDSAEDVLQAISDQIERADDLWEVVSLEGDTITLQEKTLGSVENVPELTIPEGITISYETSGRDISIVSGDDSTAVSGDSESGSASSDTSGETGSDESSDITDNGVECPSDPQKLAAVYGPSYELLTMLGYEDKIVVRADVQTDDFPWAEKIFSRIDQIPVLENVHNSVDFEELMQYEPDIVYTFPRENELNQLQKSGVYALAGETGDTLDDVKTQVNNYAATLGDDAKERAQEYCQYFDSKLSMVKERTAKIADKDKPKVYYCGVDILTTYGKYSDIIDVIEAAGGIAVSADLDAGNRSQINYEQLLAWNPDVIFIDHGGMNDGETVEELKADIMGDDLYKAVSAVENEQIYLSPSGVFYWDMGLQKILLVMNMAKILHPDEFSDINMAQEVMTFYKKFYNYDLTRDQAERILNRQEP